MLMAFLRSSSVAYFVLRALWGADWILGRENKSSTTRVKAARDSRLLTVLAGSGFAYGTWDMAGVDMLDEDRSCARVSDGRVVSPGSFILLLNTGSG